MAGVTIRALAGRTDGGVVVVGKFVQGADLGGGPIVTPGAGQFDSNDHGVVASYDDRNVLAWSHTIATTGRDEIRAVAVAADGSVVIAGTHGDQPVDFGAGPVAPAGKDDAFVVAYEPDGRLRWVRSFASADYDGIAAMSLDATTGKIAIVGRFGEGIHLDGDRARPAGEYLVELSPTGQPLWAHAMFGSQDAAGVAGVWIDPAGAVTVVGYGSQPFELDDRKQAASGTGSAMYVAHVSAAGGLAWRKYFASPSGIGPLAIAGDSAGRLHVVGGFQGTVELGVRSLHAHQQDGFAAGFAADGRSLWVQQLVGNYDTYASSIAVDAAGNTIVVGRYAREVELAGRRATTELDAGGDHASFVAKLGPDGAARWLVDNGRQRVDTAPLVAVDRSGRPLVAFEHDGENCFARSASWSR